MPTKGVMYMLNHIWSVLCRRAIVDSGTNNLTISDVLEELTIDIKIEKQNVDAMKQINLPLEFEIVSFWKKQDDVTHHLKADCEIEVLNPEGKKIKTLPQVIDMPSGMKRLRTILRVMGFVVEGSGDYTLKVNVKEEGHKTYKTVSLLPLTVNINKEVIPQQPKA